MRRTPPDLPSWIQLALCAALVTWCGWFILHDPAPRSVNAARTTTLAPVATSSTVVSAPPATPAPAEVAPPSTSTSVPTAPSSTFLACVRWSESRDHYNAVSPDGLYHGAYQFLQSTWDNTAGYAELPHLVGVPAESVVPAVQDVMAQHLFEWQGRSPWAGAPC